MVGEVQRTQTGRARRVGDGIHLNNCTTCPLYVTLTSSPSPPPRSVTHAQPERRHCKPWKGRTTAAATGTSGLPVAIAMLLTRRPRPRVAMRNFPRPTCRRVRRARRQTGARNRGRRWSMCPLLVLHGTCLRRHPPREDRGERIQRTPPPIAQCGSGGRTRRGRHSFAAAA